MANKNDAGDAAAENAVPETQTELQVTDAQQDASASIASAGDAAITDATDAPVVQPVTEGRDDEPDGEQNVAGDDPVAFVKTMIAEALAPVAARLDALETAADANEVNKLAGRLRQMEQRFRSFL